MKIEFTLPKKNNIARDFCEFIVKNMKHDIVRLTKQFHIQARIDVLQSGTFIKWRSTPHEITASHFLTLLFNNLDWGIVNKKYVIEINPNAVYPGTTTTLLSIARFVNYGDLSITGCYFLSKVFIRYQRSIYKYLLYFRLKTLR